MGKVSVLIDKTSLLSICLFEVHTGQVKQEYKVRCDIVVTDKWKIVPNKVWYDKSTHNFCLHPEQSMRLHVCIFSNRYGSASEKGHCWWAKQTWLQVCSVYMSLKCSHPSCYLPCTHIVCAFHRIWALHTCTCSIHISYNWTSISGQRQVS